MYNLRHNNIETFLGACVDPGNIAVLSEVCPRGSLMVIIMIKTVDVYLKSCISYLDRTKYKYK